jgi:crossover junction endodeoxyribonuclease RuvC
VSGELYLGCDPGASGAFAILDLAGSIVDVTKMPETPKDMSDYLSEFSPRIRIAALEHVHAMPKQGISSAFKFGRNFGMLHMGLVAHRIPFQFVSPGVWQQPLGCIVTGRKGPTDNKSAKKQLTKARAQELFPNQKITHAIADALLIAEWLRRVSLTPKS